METKEKDRKGELMNCGQCAFNISKRECAILIKKPNNGYCWAGCYTLNDLEKRYKDIMKYSSHIDGQNKAFKELNKYKKKLEGDKNVRTRISRGNKHLW